MGNIVQNCTRMYHLTMSTKMTVSEARAALPEIIDRVVAGEEVTLTRHGVAVAVVVHPGALRLRRADQAFAVAESVRVLLEHGRQGHLDKQPKLSRKRAEALLAEVKTGRSRR